jgi:hypothetical protein
MVTEKLESATTAATLARTRISSTFIFGFIFFVCGRVEKKKLLSQFSRQKTHVARICAVFAGRTAQKLIASYMFDWKLFFAAKINARASLSVRLSPELSPFPFLIPIHCCERACAWTTADSVTGCFCELKPKNQIKCYLLIAVVQFQL